MTSFDSTAANQSKRDLEKAIDEHAKKFLGCVLKLEVHEEDVSDSYAAISDPENYPSDAIKIFEGRTMVPTRLIAEKMARITKKIQE